MKKKKSRNIPANSRSKKAIVQYEKRVLLALEAQSIISFQCKKTNQTSLLPVQKGDMQVPVPVLGVRLQFFRVHRNAQGITTGILNIFSYGQGKREQNYLFSPILFQPSCFKNELLPTARLYRLER